MTLPDQLSQAPVSEPLHISADDTSAERDDRFHRFNLIGWWDQKRLARAKVLVIGAGALGNEIVKNLALLGIGQVLIVDMDRIENSNLSRSVLYRASDNGAPKAHVAARMAAEIYPGIAALGLDLNVVYDLGLGVFRWADIVLGGLDNREARLAINRNCWKTATPWIDGAIEQIQGTARVFDPTAADGQGPCYECTMSQTDWKLLQMRRSCNLLSRPEMLGGKTPTTPTISSIIAGVQCQEAVKLLHGLPTIPGRGWVFDGMSTEAYQVEFQRKPSCFSHEPLERVIPLEAGFRTITLGALLEQAMALLGPQAYLELGRDVLEKLRCPRCGCEERLMISLGKVSASQGVCPDCADSSGPAAQREIVTFHTVRAGDAVLDCTPAEVGLPPFDILIARAGGRAIGLELSGDAHSVLGQLWDGEALQWV